jgi:hypothetical protein
MISLIKDNFLSIDECNNLISFYEENKKDSIKYRDTFFLDLKENNLDKTLVNNISNISKLINGSDIDMAQIVYWPTGSFQDLHHDIALKNTTLSSVCYLNDDYEGGQTYFEDGTIFSHKKGRILFFDGKYYLHGVKKITSRNRYSLAIWNKNETK